MSAIALHQVKMPNIKDSFKKDWEVSPSHFLTPATYAASWTDTSSTHDLTPTKTYLDTTSKSIEWIDWICGTRKESPLKEKKIRQIYGQCQILKKEYSASLLMRIVSEAILLAAEYLDHMGWFQAPGVQLKIPHQDVLVPGASLILVCQKVIQLYDKYKKTTSDIKRSILYTRIIGQLSKGALYMIELVAIYSLYKLSPTLPLSLKTLNYFTVIIELFQKNTKKTPISSVDQLTYTPNSNQLILV